MCGGYSKSNPLSQMYKLPTRHIVNRDDFISKFRMTNMSEEEVRASTVTG